MKIKGRVLHIVSNLFYVEAENKLYACTSRGVFKTNDVKPVVGDIVTIEAEKELNVQCEDLQIKASKEVNIEASKDMTLKGSGIALN